MSAEQNSSVIELIDVHKALDGQKVLAGLTLAVQKGETLAIIGGSGSGKTVTLKHIVGLMKPDKGVIKINGIEITQAENSQLDEVRKKIGFVFQGGALLNSMSVYDNVALPLREHEQLSDLEVRKRVLEALELVRLSDIEKKMPAVLSGGMKKRVSVARAIIRRPEILLYDEPTAGLDPVTSNAVMELARDMQENLHVTSVIVTHDIEAVPRVADRVAMLHEGKIIHVGPWDEFVKSSDPVIRTFITGDSGK